ncbi:MAG: hypothetical protein IRZ16_06315 [Myxococcaceae bacterium]|nr:hypothetical protein [Myxococcaceae bacterium]
MTRLRLIVVAVGALTLVACVGPEDRPSKVHDLRVLGVRTDPPELMAPACIFDVSAAQGPLVQQAFTIWSTPIRYTALIADPAGNGREISWELWTCADPGDRTCSNEGDPRFRLGGGVTVGGELVVEQLPLGLTGVDIDRLANGDPSGALLFEVLQRDPYKGFDSIRVPLNLHVKAGDEEIWAQKLVPYSCNYFPKAEGAPGPTMRPNVQPELPGVTIDGKPWREDEVVALTGPGPFVAEPLPYEDLEENFVRPSFQLEPVETKESWKVAWYADLGFFSPEESGGANLGGVEERVRSEWSPGSTATEKDVTFWFVVRDGRGGQSWLTRHAHWRP